MSLDCFRRGFCVTLLLSLACAAQQQQQPSTPAPPETDLAAQAPPQQVVKQQKPPDEPAILEDGGFSIEPEYWLNRAQPGLRGGASATAYDTISYPGNANPSIGGELSVPTGHSNTLRFSYFRVQGNSNQTLSQDTTIFSEAYNPGDFLVYNYMIQGAKLSWDYLSYTWHKPSGKIRFKTLYEVQLVNVGTNFEAPYKTPTTDSSGNTDYNTANGSKNLIYPTFGGEFEEALGHHFRWEAKASGFDVPHHGNIWDAQANIALRAHGFELLIGEKAFHFETSPQGAQYFTDTLSGAFAGLRYYWGQQE